jgi:hypothetical protein
MLEMEVELHVLLTSVFDRLSRSESNNVATAFEMHERIQMDCATNIYPNTEFRCVLPNSLNDVNRFYLKNKYAITSNIPCPTMHEVDNHAYVLIQELLIILLGMGYELDCINPMEDFPEIRPKDPVSRIQKTRFARKVSLSCNVTPTKENKRRKGCG